MTEHIEWFEAVLNVTVGVYFRQQGFENASVSQLGLPSGKWLEELTDRKDISFDERVVVMLALMPHIKPRLSILSFFKMGLSTGSLLSSAAGKVCRTEAFCQQEKLRHSSLQAMTR